MLLLGRVAAFPDRSEHLGQMHQRFAVPCRLRAARSASGAACVGHDMAEGAWRNLPGVSVYCQGRMFSVLQSATASVVLTWQGQDRF